MLTFAVPPGVAYRGLWRRASAGNTPACRAFCCWPVPRGFRVHKRKLWYCRCDAAGVAPPCGARRPRRRGKGRGCMRFRECRVMEAGEGERGAAATTLAAPPDAVVLLPELAREAGARPSKNRAGASEGASAPAPKVREVGRIRMFCRQGSWQAGAGRGRQIRRRPPPPRPRYARHWAQPGRHSTQQIE